MHGLPADLLPDVAFFDAGDRASLTINKKSGQVTAQRDILATPESPRPSLTWSGDCQWDSASGGSVVLDGKGCFALLDSKSRLCDWDRGDSSELDGTAAGMMCHFEIPDADYGDYEYRCDTKSYLQGRLAAVLVYGRQLPAADVSRLLTYYRTTRWLAAGTPPSPPPAPPLPPPPPGTGLPAALMPDLAYFDASAATAGRLVVPQPGSKAATGGGVRALLDVLNPGQQRLDWFGDCRYDSAAGGGSVVLDGSSCYAQLSTNLCAEWQLMLNSNGGENLTFSLVVVLELDNTYLPPPPKPPLAPSVNSDHEIGELDTGGMGVMSYGMQDGAYYYFGSAE
ncbi:hypothetical protein HXX76_016099 [Chlamydomonas incerta]|uniref:Uncharacterized protein n=1 Tax=Chlamydomonas incerta TaxID=51695 RepID=A0A835VR08_CHLIN|nr:hypothetical protein HXX76_016099 [Chlamydomonas incerta]|eukprot:KAG2422339.1 hypothetical protein HXX76_016099 [Chlamydomonas incerta]